MNHKHLSKLSILLVLGCIFNTSSSLAVEIADTKLATFKLAWEAARQGDHNGFRQIKPRLQGFLLYPYLQYEDYRERRASVPATEMAEFLQSHADWAFTPGLRAAWLKSLAEKGRWRDLVTYSEGTGDTFLRCQRARGLIILHQTDGLLKEAQNLWAVGKSQPKSCDPVFQWLIRQDAIPASLAWERVRLAMLAGNPALVKYLARFIPVDQRHWLDDWQKLNRTGYTHLERASAWQENSHTRMISAISIERLASRDADLAAVKFRSLETHFNWGEARRAGLLHAIALHSAIDLLDNTASYMEQVPVSYRDATLLEWWARFLLGREDWMGLSAVINSMRSETRSKERWRYWLAQAELRLAKAPGASAGLASLAQEANYYGFLAADELSQPYNICPLTPNVESKEVANLAAQPGFARALELRKAGLDNWAVEEWKLAVGDLPAPELQTAAALAQREAWYDRVIFALGNSGDRRFYTWRFPLLWEGEISHHAVANQLDPAWVYGTIRSESAMLATARSPANALGLMQLTPATGRRVARKYGLSWHGSAQLQTVAGNLPIGMAFMGELLGDYRRNPVLVSGAYNAGPRAVNRWLEKRPRGEAAIWIETLPYFETRDYIPRVLAFTTLYDWRLGGDVKRISARMPGLDSGKIRFAGVTQVVCHDENDRR